MAAMATPPTVLLICGMISARVDLFAQTAEELERLFGPVEIRSDVMPFDFTHYYDRQMGSPLWRQFVSFAQPITGDALAAAKRATNELEEQFAQRLQAPDAPARPINLDPGYVDLSKLVLASCKDFSHRVYLGGGVFGEITLMYHKDRWDALGWTFPDYASGRYHGFLSAVRARLRQRGGRAC
ncbi:MAG: DUF4416 family protein [Phycisphaerae bacterium]|nr:DUF4416 family protein [Phycisphaerae bacterium]